MCDLEVIAQRNFLYLCRLCNSHLCAQKNLVVRWCDLVIFEYQSIVPRHLVLVEVVSLFVLVSLREMKKSFLVLPQVKRVKSSTHFSTRIITSPHHSCRWSLDFFGNTYHLLEDIPNRTYFSVSYRETCPCICSKFFSSFLHTIIGV